MRSRCPGLWQRQREIDLLKGLHGGSFSGLSDKLLAFGAQGEEFARLLVEPPALAPVEDRFTNDAEDDLRAKVVTIIKVFNRLDDLFARQPWILDDRQLMAHLVGHIFVEQVIVGAQVIVELRAGIRMRDGDLYRLAVEFLRILHSRFDRLMRLAGQSDDEVAVNLYAEFLAVLDKLAPLLGGRAFLDVLENLVVGGFKADDQQTATGITHRLEHVVIRVHARRARPGLLDRLQRLADFDGAALAPRESVIVKEYF